VVLKEIAIVILIGLLVDLMNTWIQNARILQWHLERG
jgi:preprotein translocase subunit SecF